jgi:VIT1/CCC1 family predicted Fe2+/Mn2+ transporter
MRKRGMAETAEEQVQQRYQVNLRNEQESATLYEALASAEREPHLAEIYRKMAEVERRHAAVWEERLRQSGAGVLEYRPSWRVRTLAWLSGRVGSGAVLPVVNGMERDAVHAYDGQAEAQAAGMVREERSHARVFRALDLASRNGASGAVLARLEGRHRAAGGNALRAAVLGASDGLTSNMSLVMGVAGASLAGRSILLTGFAGLLAGALSMAIGEWLSVQSARELNERQLTVEQEELATAPEEEQEELALIYQAKGVDKVTAHDLARHLMAQDGSALDTLAREELGIDPQELGGSAMQAAVTSFCLFAAGAVIPVIPYFVASGVGALVASLALSALGLFAIGAGITLTTGTPLLKAGGRQVIFGIAAAAITFGLGRLVGGGLG